MASTGRWDQLYAAREAKNFWRDMATLADLYVSANPARLTIGGDYSAPTKYRILIEGSRVVPYAVMAKGGDPRQDPRWDDLIAKYRAPALQDLVERNLAIAQPGGEPAEMPFTLAKIPIESITRGEYYRHSGDNSYWTDQEVAEDTARYLQYRNIYTDAVSWWMLLHGLNPDAITPYRSETQRTLQQINMVEAGDPTIGLILETTAPAAPDPTPITASRFATPAAATQAGFMNMDTVKKYWPYLAAGGVVVYMMRGKAQRG